MRHELKTIARNFRLPLREFIEFALKNTHKYGILEEGSQITISTFYTDLLVKDFNEAEENNKLALGPP